MELYQWELMEIMDLCFIVIQVVWDLTTFQEAQAAIIQEEWEVGLIILGIFLLGSLPILYPIVA